LKVGKNKTLSAVSGFYKITGESAMLPKWVFGFTQSKYSYETTDEVIELVERFKKENIPLSAVVLDLAWFNKMGDLDWNTEKFPDPKALDEYLESNNVKLITISEPFFATDSLCYDEFRKAGIFADDENGKPVLWNDWWCVNGSKEGAIINPLHPKAQQLLGDKYIKMVESGIAEYGYSYVNLDSGWQHEYGGEFDAIMPNFKFPDMKEMTDRIHALGFKCGIYSTPMLNAWG
jgi:alpha-glucosidase (family GH31 glycosyl hydrolase)